MARMLGNNKTAFDIAKRQFWIVDANVMQVQPDVLLGLSGVGGLFSKEVKLNFTCYASIRFAFASVTILKSMFTVLNHYEIQVFISLQFNTSYPKQSCQGMHLAECTPEEAFKIVGDNIIFASGSPFRDVDLGNGRIGHCNQENNMYLFPGIGLGTLLSDARLISDGLLQAAAERRGLVNDVSAFGADWANRLLFRSKFRNHFLDMEGDGGLAPNSTFRNFYDDIAAMAFDFMDELLFEGCWLETSDGFNFMHPGPSTSSGPDPNDPSQSLHQGESKAPNWGIDGIYKRYGCPHTNLGACKKRREACTYDEGQPYSLNTNCRSLKIFRDVSESYNFSVEEDSKESVGLPGRVFLRKLPEWTPDVRFFRSDQYPRIVFKRGNGTCLGVEVVTTTQEINYHPKLEHVCKAHEAVDQRSSHSFTPPGVETCNELYQAALPDIVEVLISICKRYKLSMALTWAPCLNQGKSGCRHSDENFYRCVSTLDSACFVADEGGGKIVGCPQRQVESSFRGRPPNYELPTMRLDPTTSRLRTSRIRDITKEVAAAVVQEAVKEDLAEGYHDIDARKLQNICKDEEDVLEYVQNNMWSPEYPTLVYKKD
ncbi:Detected protein of confused Function [Hibiscus syriacus]|uniref:Detected protein of confused Function n=1 Tax=Hibiscus syriacus TaxID=106335 RepID=A0A6A3C551_HIBSY|nr:Detected protein of confused Function [Hibiscus syriacus]